MKENGRVPPQGSFEKVTALAESGQLDTQTQKNAQRALLPHRTSNSKTRELRGRATRPLEDHTIAPHVTDNV